MAALDTGRGVGRGWDGQAWGNRILPERWRVELSSGHSEVLSPSLGCPLLEVPRCWPVLQGAVEPMQIDVDPQEDPQNAPDVNYVVENPTLVWSLVGCCWGGVEGSRPDSSLWLCLFSDSETIGVSIAHLQWGC